MIRIIGMLLLTACGLLIICAEGFHWIVLWNLFPLLAAGAVISRFTGRSPTSWAALTFAALTTLTVALVHAAWIFDWGGIRTGSSTAGLIFIFLPIYSRLIGACGWAAEWLQVWYLTRCHKWLQYRRHAIAFSC